MIYSLLWSPFLLTVLQTQNLTDCLRKVTLPKISTTDFMKVPNVTLEMLYSIHPGEVEQITNDVICNSVWIDVVKRHETNWNNVKYFLERDVDRDELFEEFIDYQSLTDYDTGPIAWKDAEVVVVDSSKQRSVHFRLLMYCGIISN